VMTWSGVVYVAFAIDAFSRRIVGWKADTTMQTSLVLATLEMALWQRDRDGIPLADDMVFPTTPDRSTRVLPSQPP
jgi:transposase InsO family protein